MMFFDYYGRFDYRLGSWEDEIYSYSTFMGAWLILVYYPLAHMVWGGGFLAQIHAIDFAGETLFISLVGLQV